MVPHRLLIFTAALMVSAVTARAQDIKPRSIEPGRIIAAGEFPAAAPAVKPRTIALKGIVAQGSSTPVSPAISPRTIRLVGWTAIQPRGKK
jgi:hypothetical protein